MRFHALLCMLSFATLAGAGAPLAQDASLSRAEELIDSSQPGKSIEILDRLLKREKKLAEGYLLRSTAHFLIGDRGAGVDDLDRALELDPSLIQGWRNQGGLALSERRYTDAQSAFARALELDGSDTNDELNLGVALILGGQLEAASGRFEAFLTRTGGTDDSYYLVSSNYALAGYAALATQHLAHAISIDERNRLRAKVDSRFDDLLADPSFRALMSTDSYEHPPGAYLASRNFATPYETAAGTLIAGVVDALGQLGIGFSPRIEVTPSWAIIWGELRIKVAPASPTSGRIEISAPPASLTPKAWQNRVEQIFRQIEFELAPKLPAGAGRRRP